MGSTLSGALALFMSFAVCTANSCMMANASAQADEPAQIDWSVDQWNFKAKPFWPLSFLGILNFTTNTDIQNAQLVLSPEVADVLKITDQPLLGTPYYVLFNFYQLE
jgi:hypothetical protein